MRGNVLLLMLLGFSVLFVSEIFISNDVSAITNHNLSISTNTPALESTINNTADEEVNIQKHEITINTDNPNGAKVLISSKDNKTTPTYVTGSGPATGSGSTGTSTIAESTGTISAPTKLSPNSFGFALDKNSSTIATNFSTNTTYESTDNTDRLNAKFTKLPNMYNMAEIHNISTTANNNKLSVYYGTNTNSLMREGKYEMEVLYTIVSNIPSGDIAEDNTDIIEVSPKLIPVRENQTFYKDNTITIKTNIKANKPINSTDINININNKPCTNITISQNFEQNISKTLELTCKAPQNPATQAGNKYDLNMTINKYNINTTKKNAINYIIPIPMQTFQYSQCTNMSEHEEKLMIDTRDDELYTMAKLKDGKCWMTQNLRYQLSTTKALTSQDSDVQQNWTPNRNTETTLSVSDIWINDPEYPKTVRSYYDSTKPEYGTYYTHSAATAGTDPSIDINNVDAPSSICPKGWRLPKTRDGYNSRNNDFYNLYKEYKGSASWHGGYLDGSHQMLSGEPKYVLPGYRNHSSADMYGVGSKGDWWSSTVHSWPYAYTLHMSLDSVGQRSDGNRSYGFSVRCLAREPQTIGSIGYMQDMTPEHCINSTEHQTATLKDKRDNNTYTIAKLKDGKCWMTQNLRYRLKNNVVLTPSDSDVTANWLPSRSTGNDVNENWNEDSEGNRTLRSFYDVSRPEDGVYYTHVAATAGESAGLSGEQVETNQSVCPKGWKIPRLKQENGISYNDFAGLASIYKGTATWQYGSMWIGSHEMYGVPKIANSGFKKAAGGMDRLGSSGFFWTNSTKALMDGASIMSVDVSTANPWNYARSRHDGINVRCVARY